MPKVRVLPKIAQSMRERGISASDLERTVREPEHEMPGYLGRRRLIRRIEDGHALIVATVEDLPGGDLLVVGALRTTDFNRYWRND